MIVFLLFHVLICTKKVCKKFYEKLLAHLLFIRIYCVPYARVGADVRMCVCVCVCVLANYLARPNNLR